MPRKPSTSQQRNKSRRQTQEPQDEPSSEDMDDSVGGCVRYIIFRASSGLPIKRSDLQEHTTRELKNFNVIIERVKVVLKEVYGYHLYDYDGKLKLFAVANALPYCDLDSDDETDSEEGPQDVNKVLILLILTHIFMSNGSVNEKSLVNFLKLFKIKLEEEHPLFGTVKHFINHLIKTKYLAKETEQGTQKLIYRWGSKAEKEISKLEVLKFVAKTYGQNRVESWAAQFDEARSQLSVLENSAAENMDVTEEDEE